MKTIRGSGGGKDGSGNGRTPVESPDSLRSIQYARVLDLVSEGEIVGLVNGMQSIYLDNTPLQNDDGSYNFTGASVATCVGTQSQGYIPGFGAVEAESAVSVAVKAAVPVVRSISNANANAVRVTVSVPALSLQNSDNGDLSGTSVAIAIDVQTAGGGYVERIADTISGKTTSRYQRAYRIDLTGTGPWDVRVRRLTADSVSTTLNNATYWDSYTEIIDAKLRYPNSAVVALSIDAQRFNAIPSRGYEIKGLLVRIPSNYNPTTRTYTGVWDGTFVTAWTDNPAWCFYDLITSARYGLGDFISADQVDKWALYQIGQHCDELVQDGFGGMEPRFACSLYLQSREEAYKVVNDFATIFCGMTYWGAGSIIPVQDAPSEPVALFTPANVVDGQFEYAGSSVKTRHTVALVSWNDPDDRYKQKIEYVEDPDGIAIYGIVQTEVVALGCTSRGQAHRYGRRILYTERMETETVSFRAGLDGLSVAPGEVFQTSDPVRSGVRMGGRLLSATDTDLTLDAPVTLVGAATYTLWAVLPDGTVQSRPVSTAPGTTDALTVSPAFSEAPQALAMWVLAASNLVPETWRAIGIGESSDGINAEITALKYSPNKYLEIEQDIILGTLQTSTLSARQDAPTDLVITGSLYLATSAVVGTRLTASWAGNGVRYEFQYRKQSGNWVTVRTNTASVDIQPVDPGTYEFTLTAFNTVGARSMPVTATKEVYGKTAAPANLVGLSVIAIAGRAYAGWDLSPDLDVQVGGRIMLYHTPLTSGAVWENGVYLADFNGDAVSATLPLLTGTYMAKAIDSSGNFSAASVNYVATESQVTGFTTTNTSTQAPGFSGSKTGLAVAGVTLTLDGATPIDSMIDLIDAWGYIDTLGGVASAGSYSFDSTMNFGSVVSRRLSATVQALSSDVGDLLDTRGYVDDWDSVDGGVINDTAATVFYRTTQTDPAGSPVWSAWAPFLTADVTCWGAQYRLDLASASPTHNIAISTLTVAARSSP